MPSEIDQAGQLPDREPSSADKQEQPAETRRSNPVYELFVLGELMTGPTYGYKLNEILNRILGPYHQLSWGTLYPLIRRLEREGLTTATVEKRQQGFPSVERGQSRRSYAITKAGRERFFELMLHPHSYLYHPDLFAVQLAKFAFLAPAQRLDILRHNRDSLSAIRDYYQKMLPQMKKRPELDEDERPFILQLIGYRIHMFDAELSWFEWAIAQASGEVADIQNTSQE